jgi:hypothetical protein
MYAFSLLFFLTVNIGIPQKQEIQFVYYVATLLNEPGVRCDSTRVIGVAPRNKFHPILRHDPFVCGSQCLGLFYIFSVRPSNLSTEPVNHIR